MAEQDLNLPMLAQAGDQEPKLTMEQSINRLLFNPELSDVCFLVGEQREKIYAHRVFLANESEVFKSMFYSELKETSYEIEVPDLSPVGFRNMIKYFYFKRVEHVGLSEIYPTYMAANKYLASALIRDLTDHITRNCMNVSNCCVIYDQLLKLAIDDSLIRDVKVRIASNFLEACASDSFEQIGEETLVSILKFNRLNTTELELLKACLRWTDCEVARQSLEANQANKQAAFAAIKHLIRFGDLSLSDFGSIDELPNYFTKEEAGSIFFHLSRPRYPIQIDYRSPRRSRNAWIVEAIQDGSASSYYNSSVNDLRVFIKADKAVSISSIKTFILTNYRFKFEVYKDEKQLPPDAKVVTEYMGNSQGYRIDLALPLEPNINHEMRFSFSNHCGYSHNSSYGTSKQMTLKSDESSVVFKIESAQGFHCIESIAFLGPFE